MKKICLSVVAILFAAATVMATEVPVRAKKAKHETCKTCTKEKCVKGSKCAEDKSCAGKCPMSN
ncbi:MAG: hypothetical protein ABJA76_14750 [Mucilaginibacter sp.]